MSVGQEILSPLPSVNDPTVCIINEPGRGAVVGQGASAKTSARSLASCVDHWVLTLVWDSLRGEKQPCSTECCHLYVGWWCNSHSQPALTDVHSVNGGLLVSQGPGGGVTVPPGGAHGIWPGIKDRGGQGSMPEGPGLAPSCCRRPRQPC